MQLNVPIDRVAEVVLLARKFDVKEAKTGLREGRGAVDHDETQHLERSGGDPDEQRLRSSLAAMGADQRQELVALTWLGRGDFETFDAAVEAAEQRGHATDAVEYLLGTPMLASYLEEGLSKLGHSVPDTLEDSVMRGGHAH